MGLHQIPRPLNEGSGPKELTGRRRSDAAAPLSDLMKKGSAAELLFNKPSTGGEHEELMCVIGIVRHGDRTPKQKLKMVVTNERFLSLFEKYGEIENNEVADLKLKSAVQLGDVLRVTREIIDVYQDQNGFDVDDR